MLSQPLPYFGSFFVQVFLLPTTRQLLLWKPPLESWDLADTYAATSPLIGQETLSLWIQDADSESFSTQFPMYKLQVDWHCNSHLFTLLCSGYSLLLPTISWKTALFVDVYASKISTLSPLTPLPMPSLYLFSENVLLWKEIQKVLGISVFTRLPLMWKRKWRIQIDRLKK